MKIGVFDSGRGGEIVADRLQKLFPQDDFIVVGDQANLPYGDKTQSEIIRLTDAAIQPLIKSCPIIIIACNTATAMAIDFLRAKYPNKKFIGFEPAVKPAAGSSKSGKIIVLATPATLKSTRYLSLKKRFADDTKVIEPDCGNWADKIERGEFTEDDLDPVIELARQEKVDEIVLGCTHYLAIEKTLRDELPKIEIVEPVAAVARRLTTLKNR